MVLINETQAEYQLAKPGMQRAVLYGIIDMGLQAGSTLYPDPKRKIRFQWELPDDLMADGRPMSINKHYTLSLHEKSRLCKDLTSWLGKKPEVPFDTSSLLGTACLINVIHEDREGKTYDNIASITPLMAGQEVPKAINPLLDFSLDPAHYREATFLTLPDWLRIKIETSPEYQALGNPPVVEAEGLDTNDPRFSGEADEIVL